MNRRVALRLLLGVALAGLVGTATWVVFVPTPRFIYGVAPLGADSALLLTRHNNDTARFWVQRVQADGTIAWSVEQTPFHTDESLGNTAVLATDSLILLLGQTGETDPLSQNFGDQIAVRAVSPTTGALQWETALGVGELYSAGPAFFWDGPRVYVLHPHRVGEGTIETVTALDLADGQILWTLPPATGFRLLQLTLVAPARLLLAGVDGRAVELDGTTGQEVASHALHRISCATPDQIIANLQGDLVLMARASVDEAHAPTVLPADLVGPDTRFAPSSLCGAYQSDVVHGITRNLSEVGLARVDPVSGAVRWQVWLPGSRIFDETLTADGRLPRFVPVTVYGNRAPDAPIERDVAVVDLETGNIVWTRAVTERFTTFVTAERAFAYAAYARALVALDASTGQVAQRWRVVGLGANDLAVQDFRDGRLWLTGWEYARPNALPWAVFDLATASPFYLNGEVDILQVAPTAWGDPP